MSLGLLLLASFLKLVACGQATTTAFSYSIPVDESAVQSVLSTMTDTALKQLFSQFQAARGTSAAISLASVYGSQILEGDMTDLNSLALAIATISGTQTKNEGTSIITDSQVISSSSAGGILTVDQSNSTSATTMGIINSGSSELKFTTVNSSSSYNSTSTQKGAAVRLFAATPLAFCVAVFALL